MRALDYDVVEKLGDDARKLKAEIGVLQNCIDELRDCHRRGKARQRDRDRFADAPISARLELAPPFLLGMAAQRPRRSVHLRPGGDAAGQEPGPSRRLGFGPAPVPTGCSIDGALPISGLRPSAVRDYTGTLPQCKAIARPPLAGGFVGCHRQIINISDTLNHVAARVPAVDAVSEIRLGGCHKGESARKRGRTRFYTDFGYLILHPPVDYFASTPRGPSSVTVKRGWP